MGVDVSLPHKAKHAPSLYSVVEYIGVTLLVTIPPPMDNIKLTITIEMAMA